MWTDAEEVLAEWRYESSKHPFVLKGLSEERIQACWEDSSGGYDGSAYAPIREAVVRDLEADGVLRPDATVLDLGCGPGLYEWILHDRVGSIICVDGSEGMIRRLESECASRGILNVRPVRCRWQDLRTDDAYDVVFSSLCPAMNRPEALLRMEELSRGCCVFVSSAMHIPGIAAKIWSALGRECSFRGFDTRYPCAYLEAIGRRPVLRFYRNRVRTERTVELEVERQLRSFEGCGTDPATVGKAVRDVVLRHSADGTVVEDRELTLGMIVWEPIRGRASLPLYRGRPLGAQVVDDAADPGDL